MKLTTKSNILPLLIAALFTVTMALNSYAGPRHRPANPRGVLDPRGIADPRGVFDPRGPFDPRNPARYMYGLPGGYALRTFGAAQYYYCSGTYYYPYIINGQTVYVKTTVVNGVPVVPPKPY